MGPTEMHGALGILKALRQMEDQPMNQPMKQTAKLDAPRFVQGEPMVIAGVKEHHSYKTKDESIPAQWRRSMPLMDGVKNRMGRDTFGVVLDTSNKGFDYMTGIHVRDATGLPANLESIDVPARRYAVFKHDGNVSRISDTIDAIWHDWLPKSGYRMPQGPGMTEVYGETFDPKSGSGGVELWIPIEK